MRDGTNRPLSNSKRGTGLAQTEAELLDNPVAGRPTLILRSPDFHSITEVVAEPVERRDTNRLVALLHPFPRAPRPSRRGGLVAVLGGDRHLGTQRPRRLGVGHHELRVLGRHRARRDAHLGDPLPLPAEMAHLDQPRGGGDDHLRGHVRPDVPGDPRGTRLGRLLDVPGPEPDGHVAQLQEPASLGRLRGQRVRNRLGPVLVRRPDPGPGDDARSGEDPHPEVRLRLLRPRMAGLRAAMAPLRNRLSRPRSPRDAAGPLGSFGRLDGFRGLASSPDGTRRSSRPTSSRARSSPGSPWC